MILVIGDTSTELATWTINKFGSGQLINELNFLARSEPVYFTALGDLTFDQIKIVALDADKIYFVQDLPWHDKEALSSTLVLCNHLSQFVSIEGFKKQRSNLFLSLPVTRQFIEPTLWTFGCSHTAGVGLDYPDQQVYGKLLADKLGMKWQNVAQAGSSTRWSLTHLLHADIQPNDIVIWATTSAGRIRIASKSINEVLLSWTTNKNAVLYYTDEQTTFEHLDYINTGVRYLRSLNINFILLSLVGDDVCQNQIELGCSYYKEWCLALKWAQYDKGNDNIHIGPFGHIKLAERIYNHVQLLKYDKSI